MESLLITGGSGFVGGRLAPAAAARWETYATCYRSALSGHAVHVISDFDVRTQETVESVIGEISPKVVIHAAAQASFDVCAAHPDLARQVNARGTEHVARAAERVGARLVYLSTDLVFGGRQGRYSEEDPPDPVCHYGRTKFEGERLAASLCSNCCVARVALVYGWSANASKCFTETMVGRLEGGQQVRLFVDEYRTPIHVRDLCRALLELAERDDLQGPIHLAGPQRLSRYEFGLKLAELFDFRRALLVPARIDDSPLKDLRPKDCSLQSRKAREVLQTEFAGVEEGLTAMKAA